jgi:hypothetical protein
VTHQEPIDHISQSPRRLSHEPRIRGGRRARHVNPSAPEIDHKEARPNIRAVRATLVGPVPLDTWRDIKGDGLPPFVRAILDARHPVAEVDAPEPIEVTLTPEDMETILERYTKNVTFYGPAGPVEVTLTPEERAEIIKRYTGEAPDAP